MENIIEVADLTKVFSVHHRQNDQLLTVLKSFFKPEIKKVTAVDHVSFSIKKGDINALIGPNGAGKSTLIKILSGIVFPTSGTVNVMGYIPWVSREKYVKNIGVHFGQKTQLNWELPAIDTFAITRMIYKIPPVVYRRNLDYLVDVLGVEELIQKPVRNLSLGERMKCEFICTLLHEPELVFLDEPTIGIDLISKSIIHDFVKKINKEKGTTFIITTHDLNEIENLCRTVLIINHGKIVFEDTIDNLKSLFSDKKTIYINFSRPLLADEKEQFNLQMHAPLAGKIEMDTLDKDFKSEIVHILSILPVQDMIIQTIDIENIVKKIYQAKKDFSYNKGETQKEISWKAAN